MGLPESPGGYAVDRATGAVHLRHASHATDLAKTRTVTGAESILAGRQPMPCWDCFPGARPPAKPLTGAAAARARVPSIPAKRPRRAPRSPRKT
jgi:hypothetical protein